MCAAFGLPDNVSDSGFSLEDMFLEVRQQSALARDIIASYAEGGL
jgi:hypothetical protein